MNYHSFEDYKIIREFNSKQSETDKEFKSADGIGTKITLGDGNKYIPFEISDDNKSEHYGKNKNLAPIVRAFKQGANWGWTRDNETGKDKPVKISGKKLFLAGGSVRDHLLGKKPRNVELATNGSPDEVYHILKQNGFKFTNAEGKISSGKTAFNEKEGNRNFFWVKKQNNAGRPFVFGVKVNDDEFDMEIFMKTPRGNIDSDLEPGSHLEDASGRDFTINGMYIALTNDNGPNKELIDYFGGMHHLNSKKISTIGDLESKFTEDPTRMIRFARMISSYGDPSKISSEEKEKITKLSSLLKKSDKKNVMGEFRKGMEKDGINTRDYIKIFKDLGLLSSLFPNKMIDSDIPKEFSEIGDKHMPIAWMLRLNNPDSLSDCGMEDKDLKKIKFLIKSLKIKDDIDGNSLDDLISGFLSSGIQGKTFKEFLTKIGHVKDDLASSFLNHARMPRIKMFISNSGVPEVTEQFKEFISEDGEFLFEEAKNKRNQLELQNFKKLLK